MRLLVATVLTAVVVTGCASTQPTTSAGSGATNTTSASAAGPTVAEASGTGSSLPHATPSTSKPASPVDARCPAQLDEGQYNGRQAKPVPNDITVDWVLRCRIVRQPDGSRFLVLERSDSDPAALLRALRAADEPPNSSTGVCLTIRILVPYFALVQQNGKAWAPKVPLTRCQHPQTAVLKALDGLRFRVISRKQLP